LESVSVSLEVSYLLQVPETVGQQTILVLTLHGFGMNPETMLRLTRMAVGDKCVIASIRGPNQGYLSGAPTSNDVGYNWGTHAHPELNIKLHHDIVRAVAGRLRERFSIPARRTMLMGFSQPVGLNYRFIGTHPDQAGGVVGICGGVPKNWDEPSYHAVNAPVLHISRDQDEFFPVSFVQNFPDRLKAHCSDVEFHLLPGTHRFPSKAAPLIQSWMSRVFPNGSL
jgi:predicted esterase